MNKVRLGLHYSLLSLLIISTVGQSTICTSSSLSTDTDGVGNGFEENIRESGSFFTEPAVSNGVDVNKGGLGLHSSLLSILILLAGENPVESPCIKIKEF